MKLSVFWNAAAGDVNRMEALGKGGRVTRVASRVKPESDHIDEKQREAAGTPLWTPSERTWLDVKVKRIGVNIINSRIRFPSIRFTHMFLLFWTNQFLQCTVCTVTVCCLNKVSLLVIYGLRTPPHIYLVMFIYCVSRFSSFCFLLF